MKQLYYPTILYLSNGIYFKGWSFTNSITSIGEIVFNTGMTGYQEIITDPSYAGQIITFTYPEIGNTGVNQEDYECQKIHIKGIICKKLCNYSNNWRSSLTLKNYIINNNIPHIFDIDTRALTKYLRKYGSMNGCISSKTLNIHHLKQLINNSPLMKGLDLVSQVTINKIYEFENVKNKYSIYSDIDRKINKQNNSIVKIIVIDFGVKYSILSKLKNYGCKIMVLPAYTTIHTILSHKPNGILLSNGPGDPSVVKYGIKTVKQLIKFTNIPIFGICMGHQILSLALGGSTFKLQFGHRGLNHPSGTKQNVEITSQNHGFAVNIRSIKHDNVHITHMNLNDLTLAGIKHTNKPIFSVQYHPEASPGPHDSEYLFESFIKLIRITKHNGIN